MDDRETRLITTFVELTDTMVEHYDVVEFLDFLAGACVELLGMTDAGIMLADPPGKLNFVAASSERMRLIELLELQVDEGPCVDAYQSGQAVTNVDITTSDDRWPNFSPLGRENGVRKVSAIPMRVREQTVGAMNLFGADDTLLTEADVNVAQALAHIATIGILQERTLRHSETISDQLRFALNSRVSIEQAKGLVSAQANVRMDDAFQLIRRYARNNNRPLHEIARELSSRKLPVESLTQPAADRQNH